MGFTRKERLILEKMYFRPRAYTLEELRKITRLRTEIVKSLLDKLERLRIVIKRSAKGRKPIHELVREQMKGRIPTSLYKDTSAHYQITKKGKLEYFNEFLRENSK